MPGPVLCAEDMAVNKIDHSSTIEELTFLGEQKGIRDSENCLPFNLTIRQFPGMTTFLALMIPVLAVLSEFFFFKGTY